MSDLKPEKDQPAAQLYCGNCGAPIPPGKHFCEVCLAPASLATPTPPALPPESEPPGPVGAVAPQPEAVPTEPSGADTPLTPPSPSEPDAPPPAAVVPVPPAPQAPRPQGPEVPPPAGPEMPTAPVTTPAQPAEQQVPGPVPAVIPVPPGTPPVEPPVVPADQPPVGAYIPPETPAAPAAPAGPSAWWLVLMIAGIVMATLTLFLACILLLVAADAEDSGIRLMAIFCCLVPGLLMGAAAFLGGRQYFRKRK